MAVSPSDRNQQNMLRHEGNEANPCPNDQNRYCTSKNPASKLLMALCKIFIACGIGFGSTYSLQFFERVQEPNTFMWNTTIKAFSNSIKPEAAILLYIHFLFLSRHASSKKFINSTAMSSSSASPLNTILPTLFSMPTQDMVALSPARRLFDRISFRDVVRWNSVVDCYAQSGKTDIA